MLAVCRTLTSTLGCNDGESDTDLKLILVRWRQIVYKSPKQCVKSWAVKKNNTVSGRYHFACWVGLFFFAVSLVKPVVWRFPSIDTGLFPDSRLECVHPLRQEQPWLLSDIIYPKPWQLLAYLQGLQSQRLCCPGLRLAGNSRGVT